MIADHWPHALGGMRADVPPRPRTPDHLWVTARKMEADSPKNGPSRTVN
jgi:hypothetical protein